MISFGRLTAVVLSSSLLLATAAFGQKATISAEIKGTDGRPANAAEIRIQRQDAKAAPIVMRTDRNGKWSSVMPAGTYKLTAAVAGGAESSQIIQARANKKMLVTFDMKRGSGQSAANAPVKKKTFVWVETTTGTHMGGHFEEIGGAAEHVGPHVGNVEGMSAETISRLPQTANGKSGTGGF